MRLFPALILLAAMAAASSAAEPQGVSRKEINEEIQARYKTALSFYSKGDYSRAILEWEEIVRKDGYQESAEKMIRLAHDQIDKRDKDKQDIFFAYVEAGEYQKAFLALQVLLDRDPMHPLYQKLSNRLERVLEIASRAGAGSAWLPARVAIAGYVARTDNLQTGFDGLSYAIEMNPSEKRFPRLLKLILTEDPSLSRSRNTTSMKLLDFKRFVALNHIYDGKYHLAVEVLNQVLALEPNDVTALKRIGSAYFAMKMYRESRAAWLRALEISPGDQQLRVFLARTKDGSTAQAEEPAQDHNTVLPVPEPAEEIEQADILTGETESADEFPGQDQALETEDALPGAPSASESQDEPINLAPPPQLN